MKEHKWYEDIYAIIIVCVVTSLSIYFLKVAGLLTGGAAGLTLFLSKVTPFSFGQVFFCVNLPFYILAYKEIGKKFMVKTLICVSCVSFCVDYSPNVFDIGHFSPYVAAILGGVLMGIGMLFVFRHNMSLGGISILVFYLQKRFDIKAGTVQMTIDCSIIALSFLIMPPLLILLSIVGAVFTNLVLTLYLVPGRYRVE